MPRLLRGWAWTCWTWSFPPFRGRTTDGRTARSSGSGWACVVVRVDACPSHEDTLAGFRIRRGGGGKSTRERGRGRKDWGRISRSPRGERKAVDARFEDEHGV